MSFSGDTHDGDDNARKFDPREMALRGRIGAFTTHATHDSKDITRRAREVFQGSFLTQVDPENALPVEERERRAEMARRAHYQRLAYASLEARKRNKQKRTQQ